MHAHVPGEYVARFRRQLEVNRLVVLHLVLGNDKVEPVAARDEIFVDVDSGEIFQPNRCSL